jgi:polyisoprenoid-binding protein YceI
MRLFACVALTALTLLEVGSAWAGNWEIVAERSRLGFTATFQGAEFEGEFHRYEADLTFDPADLEHSRFEVTVDVTSADTGSSDLNEGMALPEWFDFKRHARAAFVTSAIRRVGDSRYEALGALTIKGVRREVSLPFTWVRSGNHATIEGKTMLRRTDFNLGEGEWASDDALGLDVQVWARLSLRPAA